MKHLLVVIYSCQRSPSLEKHYSDAGYFTKCTEGTDFESVCTQTFAQVKNVESFTWKYLGMWPNHKEKLLQRLIGFFWLKSHLKGY